MTDPVPKPLPERVGPVVDLPMHRTPTTSVVEPTELAATDLERLRSAAPETDVAPSIPPMPIPEPRRPVFPPPVSTGPPVTAPIPPTGAGGLPAGTLSSLIGQIASLSQPFADLVKLASEQPGIPVRQKPDPMPDGSPAYASPILSGNGADVVGLIATILAQRDAFTAVLEKMSSLAGYGPDSLPDDTINSDELRALPLDELAGVVDTTSRIAAGWATGSTETDPEQFSTALTDLSDELRRMATGDPTT